MIDGSVEEAHSRFIKRHFGTTTERIVPSFKEFPMSTSPDTPKELTEVERELSELVFAHCHSDPQPGARSSLTDHFARKINGDEYCIMKIATCLAKMASPENADMIGEVAGFYIRPVSQSNPLEQTSNSEGDTRPVVEHLLEEPLLHPITGLNPWVLWARAYQELLGYHPNVSFSHEYTYDGDDDDDIPRPAIRGEGVNLLSVNTALVSVIIREKLQGQNYLELLAASIDEDGWVSPLGGGD